MLKLLVGSIYGTSYAIPSMQEVAGWVACRHPSVRRALIEIAPDIVLLLGDAGEIPVEDRAKALRALARIFTGDARLDWTIFDSDYARIADPSLDEVVNELLRASGTSIAVKIFLLGIVWIGRLASSATTALLFATDPDVDTEIRSMSVAAVGAAGSMEEKQELRKAALSATGLDNFFLAQVGRSLLPDVLSIDDLLTLIERFETNGHGDIDGPAYIVARDWVERCPASDRLRFLEALLALARKPPLQERATGKPSLSVQFSWLLDAIVHLALRLTETQSGESDVPNALIDAVLFLQKLNTHSSVHLHRLEKLEEAINKEDAVRRSAIRAHVLATAQDPDARFLLLGTQPGIYRTKLADVAWLLGDSSAEGDEMVRFALFRSAVEIWIFQGRPEDVRTTLASKIAAGRLSPKYSEQLSGLLQSPPMQGASHEEERDAQRRRMEAEVIARSRKNLEKELASIRAGTPLAPLAYLVDQLRRAPSASTSRWGQSNIVEIEKMFGAEIAAAAREGLRCAWRLWVPLLPSQLADRTKVDQGVLIGLTALVVADLDGFDFATLSDEDARAAVHYALHEINGFPDWFGSLASARPNIVALPLRKEIKAALEASPQNALDHIGLRAIRQIKPLANALASPLLDLLEGLAPPAHRLADALSLVRAAEPEETDRLRTLAAERAEALWPTNVHEALVWFREWLRLDSDAAWSFFELQVDEDPGAARDLVFNLLLFLKPDIDNDQVRDAGYLRKPTLLARMIPTVFRSFPPDEDPQRSGYWRWDDRDDARQARYGLVRLLEETEGREAHDVLRALAEHPDRLVLRP